MLEYQVAEQLWPLWCNPHQGRCPPPWQRSQGKASLEPGLLEARQARRLPRGSGHTPGSTPSPRLGRGRGSLSTLLALSLCLPTSYSREANIGILDLRLPTLINLSIRDLANFTCMVLTMAKRRVAGDSSSTSWSRKVRAPSASREQ